MPGAFTLWTFTESMSTFILATNRKISGMLKKKKKPGSPKMMQEKQAEGRERM